MDIYIRAPLERRSVEMLVLIVGLMFHVLEHGTAMGSKILKWIRSAVFIELKEIMKLNPIYASFR